MPFALVLIVAVLPLAGCAGDDEAAESQAAHSEALQSGAAESPLGDRKDTDNARSDEAGSEPDDAQPAPSTQTGRKRIRKPGGTVTITPKRPRTYTTPPGRGCVVKELGLPTGGSKRFAFPPRPGIAARRVRNGGVLVSYDVGVVDPRCRPVWLDLSLDVNDDGQSAGGRAVEPVQQRAGQISMAVPSYIREADVVIATARTRDGRPSESSRVLISE